MKLKALVLIAIVLWMSAPLWAVENTPTDGARKLVRTMRLGEVAILGAQIGLMNNTNVAGQNGALLNCIRRIKAEELVDDLAPSVDAALTPKEIEQAEQFFSQGEGQKIIDLGLRDLHRRIAKKPESPVPQTRDEAGDIDAFSKTSAGKKLLVDEVLSRPNVGEKARRHMREIVSECVQSEKRTD